MELILEYEGRLDIVKDEQIDRICKKYGGYVHSSGSWLVGVPKRDLQATFEDFEEEHDQQNRLLGELEAIGVEAWFVLDEDEDEEDEP